MFDFHKDKKRYFDIQYLTARDHILPFIEERFAIPDQSDVLEIGCGEAGVLKAFLEKGHQCVGIELYDSRLEVAKEFLQDAYQKGQVRFLNKNIYDIDIESDLGKKFDVILLKDVIEHIPDQERFMSALKAFMKPNGVVFFGFPPWQMPFGGHQQVCRNKWVSKLPYMHLLPRPLYKGVLRLFGEKNDKVSNLMEIRDTGISTRRFERILSDMSYEIKNRKLFLFNPIYTYKFNLSVKEQLGIITALPWLRDFFSTAAYYLVECRSK